MPATNLPLDLSSFVGRTAELARVRSLLETTRLVTVTGPGGIGKTRLAFRAAASLLERYADGVWIVDLSRADGRASVPGIFSGAIGTERSRHLLNAPDGRGLLLVLDNCDHVVETCADLARLLLERYTNVRLLATSRTVLGIAGEAVVLARPLGLPAATEISVKRLRHSEAAQLFLERVAAAVPAFALTADKVPCVAEICCRLEGIPLAIELAAPRVRSFGLSGVACLARDQTRLLNLQARDPEAPPRQRSLRASLDWSFGDLADTERLVLRRVAGLCSSWTLQDAQAVCADTDLLGEAFGDALDNLVARSLVCVEQRGLTARYSLLNSLRHYALGQDETVPLATSLTAREQQVLALVAQGHSNKEISSKLAIADATARVHVEHILTKLDLRSRTQAAVWALRRQATASTSATGS